MIDSKHHVQINGVNYRLAEDAEGQHYNLAGEPLRPPNAVMVQGEGRQDKFQARPDMLLWNITDWSGGEGQIVFDPQVANRHAILSDVDPFEAPGKLSAGYATIDCTDDVPATLSVNYPVLAKYETAAGLSNLALFAGNTALKWWLWDHGNSTWDVQADYSGPAAGARRVVADGPTFYIAELGTTKIWTLTEAGGAATSLTTTGIASVDGQTELALVGNYLYQVDFNGGKVYEINKTTGTATEIDSFPRADLGVDVATRHLVTVGPNRLFIGLPSGSGRSTIREITPTSAAGTGFGREIASFPNTWITSLWFHQGTIFIGTAEFSQATKRALLYYDLNGNYGALGRPRSPNEESFYGIIQGNEEANQLDETAFLVGDGALGNGTVDTRVYLLNSVSGGYAQVGQFDDNGMDAGPPIHHRNELFFVRDALAATGGVIRLRKDWYASSGYATTPWHDMGLSDEKILSSVVLSCEALPADWTVTLSYAVNGSSSFTSAGAYSTTSGTGTRYQVSTDSATKKFRTVRIKISLAYSGGGTPTTTPVIHGVEVRAQVAKPTPVWNLLVDLSDDHSGGSQSHVGSLKFTNLKTAGDLEAVIDFKDGYPNRAAGAYTSYDVIVDSYNMVLDRPGEGIAAVSLKQVV